MIRVAILDDESKSIRSLVYELEQFEDRVEIVDQYTRVEDALNKLSENQLDCLFLDIEMPGMDGFRFLDQLPDKSFEIVFVTAYSEYAIQAIRERAFDYLLKPVDGEDLDRVLTKLESQKSNQSTPAKRGKVILNTDQEIHVVDPDEILFCQSEGSYSWVIPQSGNRILVSKNLKHLEGILPDRQFFRIHHSYLVNVRRIAVLDKSHSNVILDSGVSLPLSRLRKKEFIETLKSTQKSG
ncbi:two component transcriptional regulator, LytTR family [Algoriphagus faecimaris]|uniref:Two component transcriptional regulator, LytTR family n=1 Tax=Algoriphagus faecimaris TaxID=686796 RepID=A0A1G6V8S1_9BACT|nr:LytTR family DNA-binding domain-containing protein [Algoriphagus faecimaris]SDD50110.1 two component transcriptional regulator, LytTR family [Algoriphagus faecimaris]